MSSKKSPLKSLRIDLDSPLLKENQAPQITLITPNPCQNPLSIQEQTSSTNKIMSDYFQMASLTKNKENNRQREDGEEMRDYLSIDKIHKQSQRVKGQDQDISTSQSILSFINNEELVLNQRDTNSLKQTILDSNLNMKQNNAEIINQDKTPAYMTQIDELQLTQQPLEEQGKNQNLDQNEQFQTFAKPQTLELQNLGDKDFEDEFDFPQFKHKNSQGIIAVDKNQIKSLLYSPPSNNQNQNFSQLLFNNILTANNQLLQKHESSKSLGRNHHQEINFMSQGANGSVEGGQRMKMHSPLRYFTQDAQNQNAFNSNLTFQCQPGKVLQDLLYNKNYQPTAKLTKVDLKSIIDNNFSLQNIDGQNCSHTKVRDSTNNSDKNREKSQDPDQSKTQVSIHHFNPHQVYKTSNSMMSRSARSIEVENRIRQRSQNGFYNKPATSVNRDQRIKSNQLIQEGKLEQALNEVNQMIVKSEHQSNSNSANITQSSFVLYSQSQQNEPAQAFYIRGQILEKKGDYHGAIQDYKQALQFNPKLLNAVYSKAACENKIGNYEDAIQTYNEAFALDDDFKEQRTNQSIQNQSYYMCSSNLKSNSKLKQSNPYYNYPVFGSEIKQDASNISGTGKHYMMRLTSLKSMDLINSQQDSYNNISSKDPDPFQIKQSMFSPKSVDGEPQYFKQSSVTRKDSFQTAQDRTVALSTNTGSSKDQYSKFGKVQISLDNVKSRKSENLKQSVPQSQVITLNKVNKNSEQKSKAIKEINSSIHNASDVLTQSSLPRNEMLIISPKSVSPYRDQRSMSKENRSIDSKGLNNRIETLVCKFNTLNLNENHKSRCNPINIDGSYSQFETQQSVRKSPIKNPYQILRNNKRESKIKQDKQHQEAKMTNLRKLKTTLMQKNPGYVQSTQMFQIQSKNINNTFKKEPVNMSYLQSDNKASKFNKQRKISNVEPYNPSKIALNSIPQFKNPLRDQIKTMVAQQDNIIKEESNQGKINIVKFNVKKHQDTHNNNNINNNGGGQCKTTKLVQYPQTTRNNIETYTKQSVERIPKNSTEYNLKSISQCKSGSNFRVQLQTSKLKQNIMQQNSSVETIKLKRPSNEVQVKERQRIFSARQLSLTRTNDKVFSVTRSTDIKNDFLSRQRYSASRSSSNQSRNSNMQQKASGNSVTLIGQINSIKQHIQSYKNGYDKYDIDLEQQQKFENQLKKYQAQLIQIEKRYFPSKDCQTKYFEDFVKLKVSLYYELKKYFDALALITDLANNFDLRKQSIKIYMKQQNTQKALENILKLLLSESDNTDLTYFGYYQKGKIMMLKQDYKSAIINFNNAQLIQENDHKCNFMRFQCFKALGQIEKAKDEVLNIISKEGVQLRLIYSIAREIKCDIKFRDTLEEILAIDLEDHKEDPFYEKLIIFKARYMFYDAKQQQQALQVLQTIKSKNGNILSLIIEFNYKLQNYSECLNLFENLNNKQQLSQNYFLRAKVYFKLQDYLKAIKQCENLLNLQQRPNYTDNQHLKTSQILSESLYYMQKYDKAIPYFTELINAYKTKVQAIQQTQESNQENAIQIDIDNKLQKINDKLRVLYSMRGKSYQKLQKFEEAVVDFSNIIENELQNNLKLSSSSNETSKRKSVAQELILRAICYEETGNTQRANEDMQRAIEEKFALNQHNQ
eukprot:403368987